MNVSDRIQRSVLVAALMLAPCVARAQADTARPPLFTKNDGWLATAFGVATVAVMPFDHRWAQRLQLSSNQDNQTYINSATVFRKLADPGTLLIGSGMYVTGLMAQQPTLADIGLHSTEAILAASSAGYVLKVVVGRALPGRAPFDADHYRIGGGLRRDGKFQAFPSGHTLAAFSLASTLTAEAERGWPAHAEAVGWVTYTAATLCGFSRMYNNAHWASDVVFGAGIGTLSGIAAVRYQHSHPGNWVDRALLHTSVAPAPQGRVAVGLDLDSP